MKYLLIAIMLLAASDIMSAQPIISDSASDNRSYLRIGIEPGTMITFGFQRNINAAFLDRTVTTYAEWGVALFSFGLHNSELKMGGILPLLEKGSFKVVNNLNLSVGSVITDNFDSKKLATGDEIAIGFYKPGWFFTITAEYEKIILSHIKHTEFYRTTYYEDAVNGWYKSTGGMFQFGIEGGGTIKDKYDIHFEIKKPFTERLNNYRGVPLHLNLGLGYRL